VLKRLADARAAGDRVYACIEGSAIAHSGASHGLTAPNGRAQAQVIRRALDAARVNAGALDVIEAHAVGALMSDRVELHALRAVLAESPREAPCWVASVKTNLGHLEAAAGVASVIKTALALHHGAIPRHLSLEHPIEELTRAADLLAVPRETIPWRRSRRPRYAGVSAFGLGGSLAHVVLREPQLTAAGPPARQASVAEVWQPQPTAARAQPLDEAASADERRQPLTAAPPHARQASAAEVWQPQPTAARRARSLTEPDFGIAAPAPVPPRAKAVAPARELLAPAPVPPRADAGTAPPNVSVTTVRHVWLPRADLAATRGPAARLLVLSAKHDNALRELARRYAEHLSHASLERVCASAQLERTQLPLRAAFVAAEGTDMVRALRAFAAAPRRSSVSRSRVAVLFGEGASDAHAVRELCAQLPAFHAAFERAAAWLSELLPLPLTAAALDGAAASDWHGLALLLAQQYALFEQLERCGLEPHVMIGSDVSDCLAAAAAGAIDWRSGLRLALMQAQLMASVEPGATVTRSLRQVRREAGLLHDRPTHCTLVLAGCDEPIASGARLPPEHMQAQLLRDPRPKPHPAAAELACACVIELGGAPSPAAHGGEHLHVRRHADLLQTLGRLFELGLDLDFSTLSSPSARSPSPLPSYPFQHPDPASEPVVSHAPVEPALARSSHPLLRHMTRAHGEPEARKRKRTG
jgi:acyl transferase domain-containing protein